MAEAFFNHFSKTDKAISAGTKPDKRMHPSTIQVMKEVGINMGRQRPKPLTDKILRKANKIVVMDPELLRNIPPRYNSKIIKWQIEKLYGKSKAKVRKIRDRIKNKVKQLIKKEE